MGRHLGTLSKSVPAECSPRSCAAPGPGLFGQGHSPPHCHPFTALQGEHAMLPHCKAMGLNGSCPPKCPQEAWSSGSSFHTSNSQMRTPGPTSRPSIPR